MCCRHLWFVIWIWDLHLVDLELLGPGYFVHNQKPFVSDSSPSQGAPAAVHASGLPLFQGVLVHSPWLPLFPIISTTSWWMQWSSNWHLENTRRGETLLTHSFPRPYEKLHYLFWGETGFSWAPACADMGRSIRHLGIAVLMHGNQPLCSALGSGVQGQCWLSSPRWQSPLLSPPAC